MSVLHFAASLPLFSSSESVLWMNLISLCCRMFRLIKSEFGGAYATFFLDPVVTVLPFKLILSIIEMCTFGFTILTTDPVIRWLLLGLDFLCPIELSFFDFVSGTDFWLLNCFCEHEALSTCKFWSISGESEWATLSALKSFYSIGSNPFFGECR